MNAPTTSANAYLRTKVLTAPPEELRLMLLDGAIKFCRQGRDGIATKKWEQSFNGFSKCRAILTELMTSMRPEIDPDLCSRLMGLYTFLYTHIMEASHEKDVGKADKVIELLEYERQTWALLIAKLREDKGIMEAARAQVAAEPVVAGASAGDPAAPPVGPPAGYRPVSFQG